MIHFPYHSFNISHNAHNQMDIAIAASQERADSKDTMEDIDTVAKDTFYRINYTPGTAGVNNWRVNRHSILPGAMDWSADFGGPWDCLPIVSTFLTHKERLSLYRAYEDEMPEAIAAQIGKIIRLQTNHLSFLTIKKKAVINAAQSYVLPIVDALAGHIQTLHDIQVERCSLPNELLYVRAVAAIGIFNSCVLMFLKTIDDPRVGHLPCGWLNSSAHMNLPLIQMQKHITAYFKGAEILLDVYGAKQYHTWTYRPCPVVKHMLVQSAWRLLLDLGSRNQWLVQVPGRSRIEFVLDFDIQHVCWVTTDVFQRLTSRDGWVPSVSLVDTSSL